MAYFLQRTQAIEGFVLELCKIHSYKFTCGVHMKSFYILLHLLWWCYYKTAHILKSSQKYMHSPFKIQPPGKKKNLLKQEVTNVLFSEKSISSVAHEIQFP